MKTYNNLYNKICSMGNLTIAWRKARKGKTNRPDVIEFENDIQRNLLSLYYELTTATYQPLQLVSFILRDPKTRKISKSNFRDRVVHHAIINLIGPIFESRFIYDSCAGRIGKGTLFAVKRFEKFTRIVSKNAKNHPNKFNDNNFVNGYCLKADIKQYFPNIDHEILLEIIARKIKDEQVLWLIRQIITHSSSSEGGEHTKGMPLGNVTSQFFANVYLNELDYFVKHELKAKYYIRYVDDFVLLHESKEQLIYWFKEIDIFLKTKLKLKLHPDKSRIISLSKGVDFVGFRHFAYFRLLRKRNIRKMNKKVVNYRIDNSSFSKLFNSYRGWRGYAQVGNTFKLRNKLKKEIIDLLLSKV